MDTVDDSLGVEVPAELVPLTKEQQQIVNEIVAKEIARETEETAKETARLSALKKLAKLGLTPEEITALTS